MPAAAAAFPRSMRLFALAVGAATAVLLGGCQRGEAQGEGGPPTAPPVSAAPAVQKDVALFEEFSGRLEAVESVELRSRVAGTLDRVHFRDGQEVRRGELLFSIDARPFSAELARLEAQLGAAHTARSLADTGLARTRKLLAQNVVSPQAADQAEANARNTDAAVRAAEAAVVSARLNLEYTRIRAPIAGRVSRAGVTAGNLVGVGEPVLTTLVAQDEVHAWFEVSEQAYLRTRAALQEAQRPKVEMGLADEAGFPHAGEVDFVDNRLNPATGAIRMRAVFDNRDRRFMPGLFARVRLASGTAGGAVLTPDRAIGTDQSRRFVFVVGADKLAQFRQVELGPLVGGMRIVTRGLEAGELVVVNGLQRVRPGAPVQAQVLSVDQHGMPVEAPPAPPAGTTPASAPASTPAK